MIDATLGMIGIVIVSCMIGLALAIFGSGLGRIVNYCRRRR